MFQPICFSFHSLSFTHPHLHTPISLPCSHLLANISLTLTTTHPLTSQHPATHTHTFTHTHTHTHDLTHVLWKRRQFPLHTFYPSDKFFPGIFFFFFLGRKTWFEKSFFFLPFLHHVVHVVLALVSQAIGQVLYYGHQILYNRSTLGQGIECGPLGVTWGPCEGQRIGKCSEDG